MRAILHVKFGDRLAEPSHAADKVPPASADPQPRDESVEAFQAALTKAQADWRARRGRARTVTCNATLARRKDFVT